MIVVAAVVAAVVAVCLVAVKSVRRVRVSAVPDDLLRDGRCCTLWAPVVNGVDLVGTLLALIFMI